MWKKIKDKIFGSTEPPEDPRPLQYSQPPPYYGPPHNLFPQYAGTPQFRDGGQILDREMGFLRSYQAPQPHYGLYPPQPPIPYQYPQFLPGNSPPNNVHAGFGSQANHPFFSLAKTPMLPVQMMQPPIPPWHLNHGQSEHRRPVKDELNRKPLPEIPAAPTKDTPASHVADIKQLDASSAGKVPELPKGPVSEASPNTSQRVPKFPWEVDREAWHWPNGDLSRRILQDQETVSLKFNQWAWQSTGNDIRGRAVNRCLGVVECTTKGCNYVARPKTQHAARTQQVSRPCTSCGGIMKHTACETAKTYYYSQARDEKLYSVWEHSGEHDHRRPPKPRNSPEDTEELYSLVRRNRHATAHELRTGTSDPDARPLHEINPKMADPNVARYHVNQAKKALGVTPSPVARGGFAFLDALTKTVKELEAKYNTKFLIDSSVHQPAVYMCFQTAFMEQLIVESVTAWVKEDNSLGPLLELHIIGRHGFVTDGDHTYFVQGVLLATCVFSSRLVCWAPALWTWIQRQDIAHHRPHFRILFRIIIRTLKELNQPIDGKYLTNIMDFSGSQRGAHAEEYADALMSTLSGLLAEEVKAAQRKEFLAEAQRALVGCDVHFMRSVIRVKRDASLVPVEQAREFDGLLHELLAQSTTSERFDEIVAAIRRKFPKLKEWIHWWILPHNASMIFPAKSQHTEEMAAEVPSSSNAVEHSHSLLHHAVGKNYDIIPGIEKLVQHISEFEARNRAAQDSHYTPQDQIKSPSKTHRLNKGKPFEPDPDSGRAPDTAEMLRKLDAKSAKDAPLPDDTLISVSSSPFLLYSYTWLSPNSCFWDHGMELFFRAFLQIPSRTQDEMLEKIAPDSVLGGIFHHFSRRLRLLASSKTTEDTLKRELQLGQRTVKHAIFNTLNGGLHYMNDKVHGCALTWITRAIRASSLPVQMYFGVMHILHYKCTKCGLQRAVDAMERPEDSFLWKLDDFARTRSSLKKDDIDINEVLSKYIPRRNIGPQRGTTVLHLLDADMCLTCQENTLAIDSIETVWPQFLQFRPENILPRQVDWHKVPQLGFSQHLEINGSSGAAVKYSLVGRVHTAPNHFKAQLFVGNTWSMYNDLHHNGRLLPSPHGFSDKDRTAWYYLYVRTSEHRKSVRTISDLERDYFDVDIPMGSPVSIHSDLKTDAEAAKDSKPSRNSSPWLEDVDAKGKTRESTPEVTTINCSECKLRQTLTSKLALSDRIQLVQCSVCSEHMHDQCMRSHGHLTVNWEHVESTGWCCPDCLAPDGLWDRRMLGRFLLLPLDPETKQHVSLQKSEARLFPAEIVACDNSKRTAQLKWYEGNVYTSEFPLPKENTFSKTMQECYLTYTRSQDFHPFHEKGTCKIKWPLRLLEEAAQNHGYRHPKIEWALKDAGPVILQILAGNRPHPILEDLAGWLKDRQHVPLEEREFSFSHEYFAHLFTFPGDNSLAEPLVTKMIQEIHGTEGNSARLLHPDRVLIQLGGILFKLVLLRVYLQQTPLQDADIYRLATAPQGAPFYLKRTLTPPESALAAIRGSYDTLFHLPAPFTPTNSSFALEIDQAMLLPETSTPVEIFAPFGKTVVWGSSSDHMLSSSGSVPPETLPSTNKAGTKKRKREEPPKASIHRMGLRPGKTNAR